MYLILAIFCLVFTTSCSEDLGEINEGTSLEFEEGISFKSINEIDDWAFLNQFSKSEKYVESIISDNFNHLLAGYNLEDLSIDTDNIYVVKESESIIIYTLSIIIPTKIGEEVLNAFLTLNFDSGTNTSNQLQMGYDAKYIIDFNSNGEITENVNFAKYGGSSPKPSNIPSKAPKSVLCRWASSSGNLGLTNGACGYTVGIGGQPPIEMLVNMFPRWYDYIQGEWVRRETIRPLPPPPYNGTHSYMDLTILTDPDDLEQTVSFGSVFGYSPYSTNKLRVEIVEFYPRVLVTQGNFVTTVTGERLRLEHHIHKQSFVDSFYQWLFEMEDVVPNTFNIVNNNVHIQGQLFELFANFNIPNAFSEGVYLNDPEGLASENQNLKNLTCMSNYLLTPAGFDFINNPSNLTLSPEGYKSALQYKMYLEQAYCP